MRRHEQPEYEVTFELELPYYADELRKLGVDLLRNANGDVYRAGVVCWVSQPYLCID